MASFLLSQADVVNVSPGTQYTVTVAAASASSSNISPGVSRMINTNETAPGPPSGLEGEAVGSNGILLSWTVPPDSNNIDGYVIRYKEVCPYPDSTFTEVTKFLDIPETLLTDFTSGSTYHIEVAAISSAGVGAFSKSLYIKTAESPPGLVTNLTAFAQNHSFVVVTWFLPRRINGLITKFAVKAKHARTGQTVRTLEVNAEDIMTVALPHCNVQLHTTDAADILSRATPSPLEMTASSPPITLSAVPSAASWSVPISVGVDQLRPYTAYLFEVSAFTSDGEGQIASTMVRMPESAPEDPPQNFEILNMTSRSISVSWSSPNIVTGKFSYMLYLYGPTGYLYENSTGDMQFTFAGLNPYTRYMLEVRAKAAGEVGPSVQTDLITPAEAPSAVQDLQAEAEDSVSIRVSWRSPAQPNGLITRYRLQVLVDDLANTNSQLTVDSTISHLPESSTNYSSALLSTNFQSAGSAVSRTAVFVPTSVPPATLPPWLTRQTQAGVGGVTVKEEVLDVLPETLTYLVSDLNPFTEYTFRVTASTAVGEGPATDITEKTREQVPSSVLDISYQNISSTSILVSWVPPLNLTGGSPITLSTASNCKVIRP
uniref:Fibronectin type-III domain-containing protein n=1 Tax=Tetraodon nigroviridis TaxID=99883 RepID=H3DPG9_TETNG